MLMGARAYNTNTGRFSQTDPVSGGSANAYDYSAQNPITNMDLSGKWYWDIYDDGGDRYTVYIHIKIEYLAMTLWAVAAAGTAFAGAFCAVMALPSAAGSIVAGALCAAVFGAVVSAMAEYTSDLNQNATNVDFFWKISFAEHHWGWFHIPYWIPHWEYGGADTWS